MKKINQNTLFANKILYYTSYSLLFIISLTNNGMESNPANKLPNFEHHEPKQQYKLPPISTVYALVPTDAKLKLKIPDKTFESLKKELQNLDSSNVTYTTKKRNFSSDIKPLFTKFITKNPEYIDQIVGTDGTPLHYAAKYGAQELCRWLLDNHANPFIENSAQKIPIIIADIYHHARVKDMIAKSMYTYRKE